VGADENPTNAFDATIRSLSFLGAQTQLELDFGGHDINLLVPGHYQASVGDNVRAVIDADNVLVIVDDESVVQDALS